MCYLCLTEYYSTTERISLLISGVTCIHIKGKLKDQFQHSRISGANSREVSFTPGGVLDRLSGGKHTTSFNYAFYIS